MARKSEDWPLAEAKARFSELVGFAEENGPQYVTKRGKRTAVLVPIEEFERLEGKPRKTAIDWLLAPEPRFELDLIDRKQLRLRKPPKF
jgi:antitoxin Phd